MRRVDQRDLLAAAGSAAALVTAILTPGPGPLVVDAYIVLCLPDGRLLSLGAGGGIVPGIVPIASGFAPFPASGELLRYTFRGGEPVGTYTWFSALTEAGTPNVVGTVDQDNFTVGP